MALNQRILRVGAIVAVAGATGLVMQLRAPEALPLSEAQFPAEAAPQPLTAAVDQTADDSPSDTPVQPLTDVTAVAAGPVEPQPTPQPTTALTEVSGAKTETAPQAESSTTASDAPPDCSLDMALVVQPGAMLDLGVISPCRPGQRVVIRHAGLAITGLTSAAGTLIASIPALESPAEVSLTFLDGATTADTATVPDLDRYDRFAVQWHEADAFQLRAYPRGFDAGEDGVIAKSNPGAISAAGGYLLALGEAAAPRALLAEVFTWPAGQRATQSAMKLALEAAVTPTTCAREILGETLQLSAGSLVVRDISIEMPDCSATGEYLALPNPVLPEKLASN